MLRTILAFVTAMFSLPCAAQCPAADLLTKTYGISFSGFKNAIPRVVQPAVSGARVTDLITVALPNPKGNVPDGFVHSALINTRTKEAWIKRIGGFASVYEWYGPVKLAAVNFEGCIVQTPQ